MLRQRQRKTIEELYGGKYEAPKSQVTATTQPNNAQKTGRTTERNCGYIISTNTDYNAHTPPPLSATAGCTAATKHLNTGKETSRRKSARYPNKLFNEKHCAKEIFIQEDGRRSPMQTYKDGKVSFIAPVNNTTMYDNKMFGNSKDITADRVSPHHHQHHHHQHNHHNHRHNGHDEDKDDDTDEFFELIRRTVEGAIGKSISELLNRNFKELCSKVERFSADLKNSNAQLSQMQNELSNKIVHYGEENSRHFRYLCMKSEYDKMFYQHQILISAASTPKTPNNTTETTQPVKRKSAPKLSSSAPKMQRSNGEKINAAGPCRSGKCKDPVNELKSPNKTSCEDISQKSSEVGMREVLEHIQKFCTQMQLNDYKCEQSIEEGAGSSQKRNVMCPEELIKINRDIFAEDDEEADEEDDDWEISMTPRNSEDVLNKYGAATARGCVTQRGNNGAGDG